MEANMYSEYLGRFITHIQTVEEQLQSPLKAGALQWRPEGRVSSCKWVVQACPACVTTSYHQPALAIEPSSAARPDKEASSLYPASQP